MISLALEIECVCSPALSLSPSSSSSVAVNAEKPSCANTNDELGVQSNYSLGTSSDNRLPDVKPYNLCF